MCKRIILSVVMIAAFYVCKAQYTVTGIVTAKNNKALEGVSITIRDSYYGTTSGKDGTFSFSVPDSGTLIIVFSFSGFKTTEQELIVKEAVTRVQVQLKEEITEMKAVVIIAGSFESGDKKRTTILKSVDVVTTAGQQADIVAALKTLPGTQQVGEQEGLFVRGGTGSEAKVFIDGMMVTNPFYSSVPGIAQRSRFSPLLFKGTIFSSGGYSALYGQGMSSALILESIDLPSRSEVNLIVSSAQMSVMGQRLNKAKSGSTGFNINYSNLAPYYSVVHQKYPFNKAPEALNGDFNWRRKVKGGIVKLYAYGNQNEIGFSRPHLDDSSYREKFNIQNKNVFSNGTFSGRLSSNWQLFAGVSFSYNQDNITMKTGNNDTTAWSFLPQLINRTSQGKIVFTKNFPGMTKLHFGSEYQKVVDKIVAKDSIKERTITDNYFAGFAESDIYFSTNLVSRTGVRYEYSSLSGKMVVAPRFSLALKFKNGGQVSFAYGKFYQKPETNFLLRKPSLHFTYATHYILNYQKVFNGQTFRVEVFNKDYKNLLTTKPGEPFTLANEGNGYARGFELFWRDRTNIKNLDYWVSYSFLDTKRRYLEYTSQVQPAFAAKHTLSVVGKRWVNTLSTQFSATYSYASGRPYYNPNRSEREFMRDRTMDYHSLGVQANYLKTFGHVNAVFIVNISNALGNKQVFSYRYASKINAEGNYVSEAVTPMAKRFIFLGAYLSIGSDRRKNILD